MTEQPSEQTWTRRISSSQGKKIRFKELLKYRYLIILFVKRSFVAYYKQTVLGPAWAVIQPLLTTLVFTVIFGNIAKLPTDGVPPFLFYMCGNIAWTYFSTCLTKTSSTFITNAHIFSKVYFPRLIMPVATVIEQMISFFIQLCMTLVFILIYALNPLYSVQPSWEIVLLPLLVLQMAMLGLGVGVIISAMTIKYRDLAMLVTFGVQLWMYASPVTYATSLIPDKWMILYMLNPMSPVITTFRYALLGVGAFELSYYLIGWLITLAIFFIGLKMFARVEKTFIDTV